MQITLHTIYTQLCNFDSRINSLIIILLMMTSGHVIIDGWLVMYIVTFIIDIAGKESAHTLVEMLWCADVLQFRSFMQFTILLDSNLVFRKRPLVNILFAWSIPCSLMLDRFSIPTFPVVCLHLALYFVFISYNIYSKQDGRPTCNAHVT